MKFNSLIIQFDNIASTHSSVKIDFKHQKCEQKDWYGCLDFLGRFKTCSLEDEITNGKLHFDCLTETIDTYQRIVYKHYDF